MLPTIRLFFQGLATLHGLGLGLVHPIGAPYAISETFEFLTFPQFARNDNSGLQIAIDQKGHLFKGLSLHCIDSAAPLGVHAQGADHLPDAFRRRMVPSSAGNGQAAAEFGRKCRMPLQCGTW